MEHIANKHSVQPKLRGYSLVTYIPSKTHGLITKSDVPRESPACSDNSQHIEWVSVWSVSTSTATRLPTYTNDLNRATAVLIASPPAIYSVDPNSHHPIWGYSDINNGNTIGYLPTAVLYRLHLLLEYTIYYNLLYRLGLGASCNLYYY